MPEEKDPRNEVKQVPAKEKPQLAPKPEDQDDPRRKTSAATMARRKGGKGRG